MMSVVLTVTGALAGVLFLAAGTFSVVTLLWGDLLEHDESEISRVC